MGNRVLVRSTNHIKRLTPLLLQHATNVTRTAALEQKTGSQERAPVRTGELRDSHQLIQVAPMHWLVVVLAEHGRPVNDGHVVANQYGGPYSYVSANPFWSTTLEQVRPRFFEAARTLKGLL